MNYTISYFKASPLDIGNKLHPFHVITIIIVRNIQLLLIPVMHTIVKIFTQLRNLFYQISN